VTYRDDREADQERITALESELAHARDKIANLEGRREQALVLAGSRALAQQPRRAKWLGAPMRLELTREFDGEFPPARFEDLLPTIRSVGGQRGRTELLRSSFSWEATQAQRGVMPTTTLTIAVKDGKTTLVVADHLGQLAGGIYGGVGGGVGGGAMIVPLALSHFFIPALVPVFVLGWLGGVFAGTRAIFKRAARRRAERVQQLFDAVAAEIEAVLKPES
jgi:hypothetical protein